MKHPYHYAKHFYYAIIPLKQGLNLCANPKPSTKTKKNPKKNKKKPQQRKNTAQYPTTFEKENKK